MQGSGEEGQWDSGDSQVKAGKGGEVNADEAQPAKNPRHWSLAEGREPKEGPLLGNLEGLKG